MLNRNTERIKSLDVSKGIAIFLMLYGHCIQYCSNNEFDFHDDSVSRFIGSINMPLFMLISGYLFYFSCQKRDLKDLLIHRTQGLIQSIVMCTILIYYLDSIPYLIETCDLGIFLDGKWINNLSSIWFLWSVLAASIVVGIFYKVTSKPWIRILLMMLGFVLVLLFPNGKRNFNMYPYFLVGFYFNQYRYLLPRVIYRFRLLIVAVFIALYILRCNISLDTSQILSYLISRLLDYSVGLSGSVSVIVLVECFIKFENKINLFFISKGLANLGKKSLQIYCISISLLSFYLPLIYSWVCSKLGHSLFVNYGFAYDFLFTFPLTVAYSFILYFVVALLEKCRVSKILFGK